MALSSHFVPDCYLSFDFYVVVSLEQLGKFILTKSLKRNIVHTLYTWVSDEHILLKYSTHAQK